MPKELSFNDLRVTAKRLGDWIHAIQSGGGYQGSLRGKADKLQAIATALELLGSTPNAMVNRKALDAWREEVKAARKAIKEVTKVILTQQAENDDCGDIDW